MYATLKFDTEDVYYPPQYRIDDIPGWLAQTMTEAGLRGTFCVFAEKARTLKERGRQDVLSAMAGHDLVSHQKGNVRPLIPEILQDKGWDDGVAAMRDYEDEVAEDFRQAFGREPVGLSRHNVYWAPQHVAVAGERGIPYVYGVVPLPGSEQPAWYAGTLNLPNVTCPSFAGFDVIYSCDDAFEAKLRQLGEFLTSCAQRGVEYVSLFGCHPVRVMARGWIEEYCLASELTRTPKEVGWMYCLKSPQEEARARANFARLCRFLKDFPHLEVIGTEEAHRLFSTQPEDITRDELTAYAEKVQSANRPVLDGTFSPAEMLAGLAESLVQLGEQGDIPYMVKRRSVLGPHSRPAVGREVDIVTHEQIVDLSRQTVLCVQSQGCLPANVQAPSGRVGAGQLLVVLARSYLAAARYERYERLRVPKTTRYPEEALRLDAWVQQCLGEHWPYALDFSCEKIAEHARLQAWTLKPAWLRPPRGAPYSEGRMKT